MKEMLKSKYFWLLAILVAAVVFSIGINSQKIYQSEIKILILPKSAIAAQNIDQIIENAKEIPRSLSFYDKLVEFNPNIEDGSFNLPDQKRRDAWNSKMEIKRVDKSGIINISAFDKDQTQAEAISIQVAKDLATVMNKYYDTKADLDMRVIDGPIVYLVSQAKIISWVLMSLLAGLLLSLAIFSIVGIYSEKFFEPEKTIGSTFSLAGLEKYDFRQPAVSLSQDKKASAPSNLPIGDESIIAVDEQPKELSLEEKKYLHREATPEEVKERLNKLLRGN